MLTNTISPLNSTSPYFQVNYEDKTNSLIFKESEDITLEEAKNNIELIYAHLNYTIAYHPNNESVSSIAQHLFKAYEAKLGLTGNIYTFCFKFFVETERTILKNKVEEIIYSEVDFKIYPELPLEIWDVILTFIPQHSNRYNLSNKYNHKSFTIPKKIRFINNNNNPLKTLGLSFDILKSFIKANNASITTLNFKSMSSDEMFELLNDCPNLKRLSYSGYNSRNYFEINWLKWNYFNLENSINLTSLDLSGLKLEKIHIKIIFEKDNFKNLIHLSVAHNILGFKGVKALLAKLPEFLTTLNASYNYLGDNGIKEIANSARMSQIREIDLSFNEITSVGVIEFANSKNLSNLKVLNLKGNFIGHSASEAINKIENLANLTSLKQFPQSPRPLYG